MEGGTADSGELIGTFIGSYQVTRRIGAGGMGDVYELVHPGIGKRLAAKVLHPELAARPHIAARFFDEARAANHIGHPGIVDVLDHGELPGGRPYLLMELLDGQSVADLITARGALPLPQVQSIVLAALDALAAAHERGIIHRDLKPDNLFLTTAGTLKVLDFGIAKLSSEVRSGQIPTLTGELLGTPRYMAPEQATGKVRGIDARTDVYGMGAVLYEMLTGRPPFASTTLAQLIEAHVSQAPRDPGELRRDLPASWSRIVGRCLAKDPGARYGSAGELRAAVAAATTVPRVKAAGPGDETELAGEATILDDPIHPAPAGLDPAPADLDRHERPTVVAGPVPHRPTPVLPAPAAIGPATAEVHEQRRPLGSGRLVWLALAVAAASVVGFSICWWLWRG